MEEKMAESLKNFMKRVEREAGMTLNRIPDAEEDAMLGGSIAASSPHGTLVLVDWSHQDEDSYDIYERVVLVNRSPNLPPADKDATGRFADEGVEID